MALQLTLEAVLDGVQLNNGDWLAWARGQAKTISVLQGFVTIDDLRDAADKYGLQPDSPHAWGAVFKTPDWRCIGQQRSRYQSNNGRFVRRWRLTSHQTTQRG